MGDDMYDDCDSDLEVEMDRKNMERDVRIERIKNGINLNFNIFLGIEHNDADKLNKNENSLDEDPIKLSD